MRRRQRTLAEFLIRSLAVSGLVYAAVLTYAIASALLPAGVVRPSPFEAEENRLGQGPAQPTWRPAHESRFPGCVDMARWDQPTTPTSVVVVRRDGHPARIPFDEAFHRATSKSKADDVWTVGACR